MKKLFTIFVAVLLTASVFAQSPEKMSYQAVIRNSSDVLVIDTQVGIQISILQGTADGSPVYVETQTPTTNANGLVSIEIGDGKVLNGDFSAIDWANGPYFIKTETDPTGGTSYTVTGTSQLLSVPYALHANTSGSSIPGPQGEQGLQGETGEQGLQGEQGIQGEQGEAGADGVGGVTQVAASSILSLSGAGTVVNPYIIDATETDPLFTAWDKNYADLTNTPTTITTEQANAIVANTAKVGITPAQATAISDNTAKTGITTVQADAITANTAKVGYTDALVSANTDVVANTAKVGITGAQTTKLAGIADGAEVNVQADWNQATTTADDFIKNKPTIPTAADGSETKVTAGTNVTVTGIGTTVSPYVVNATGATALTIGQSHQGGIIFWLDATGQHGLIAATADQSTGIQWYNGIYRYTGTTGDGLYAGAMNTTMIVATQMADNQAGNFAAKVCADYSVTDGGVTYGDWYLPSKYELNLLYLQKTAVGGFASAYYWSSSETGSYGGAWIQYFDDGHQVYGNKDYTYYVRAVRAF